MSYIIQTEIIFSITDAIKYKRNLESELKVEEFAEKIFDFSTCADIQIAEKTTSNAERNAKIA